MTMTPVAPDRRGAPRPLIFYLQAALAARSHALSAAQNPDREDIWITPLRASAKKLAEAADPSEVGRLGMEGLAEMIAGIERYQSHPYRRPDPQRDVIWQSGGARLLDWGGNGAPVLVIPSLVNRAYVLDLMQGASFLDHVAARGLRPMLLDWGDVGAAEMAFSMSSYLKQRVLPAAEVVAAAGNGPLRVLGYCMGGTLSVAMAAHLGAGVGALALLGAPWDFSSISGVAGLPQQPGRADITTVLDTAEATFGLIPSELFQTLFAAIAPMQATAKFRRFGQMQDGAEAERFVAVEDWLNDPVHMAPAAARDVLCGWYGQNEPGAGRWAPLGKPVDPRGISANTLIVTGTRDHITPSASIVPLTQNLPHVHRLDVDAGHVGMVLGASAMTAVADPICAHLRR